MRAKPTGQDKMMARSIFLFQNLTIIKIITSKNAVIMKALDPVVIPKNIKSTEGKIFNSSIWFFENKAKNKDMPKPNVKYMDTALTLSK